MQYGKAILRMTVSFEKDLSEQEEIDSYNLLAHQNKAPAVPPPDDVASIQVRSVCGRNQP